MISIFIDIFNVNEGEIYINVTLLGGQNEKEKRKNTFYFRVFP